MALSITRPRCALKAGTRWIRRWLYGSTESARRQATRKNRLQMHALEDRMVPASMWTVTSLGDSVGGTANVAGVSGDLRYCASQAASGDTIQFGLPGTITLTEGELVLNQPIAIQGLGYLNTTIAGSGHHRIFDVMVTTAGQVNVSNVTLTGGMGTDGGAALIRSGDMTIASCNLAHNMASMTGGAVANAGSGLVTIVDSVVDTNYAQSDGGGIANLGNGTVSISYCFVIGNTATFHSGGGLLNLKTEGLLHVDHTKIYKNFAYDGGGAIYSRGSIDLFNCSITDNWAGYCGGGLLRSGIVGKSDIVQCTISGNYTGDPTGGGIALYNAANLDVYNTTIVYNTAYYGMGGGIYNDLDAPGNLNIYSTLIAFNDSNLGVAPESSDVSGPVTERFSYLSSTNGAIITDQGNNVTGTVTLLSQPYSETILGTPTPFQYFVPQPGSCVIDAGDNAARNLVWDQAGMVNSSARLKPTWYEIGAADIGGGPPPMVPVIVGSTTKGVFGPAATMYITVDIFDDVPLATPSFDDFDLKVRDAKDLVIVATFDHLDPGTPSGITRATYRFVPPGGSWSPDDNGSYTVELQANQIQDTMGRYAPAGQVGSIYVALAQTFVVTTTADSGPGSLREAITAANATVGTHDSITFAPGIFSGAHTIALTGDSLEIIDALSIIGPGANLLKVATGGGLNGATDKRVFDINVFPGQPVSVSGMTLDGTVDQDLGGVIRSRGAALTISGCNFVHEATSLQARSGGAISHEPDADSLKAGAGSLTMRNCTISGFSTTEEGGAIAIMEKGAQFINCTFSGNSAGTNGGAIAIATNGDVTLHNCTLAYNSAAKGGGIANEGTLNLVSTILAKNTSPTGADLSGAATADHSLIGSSAAATISGTNNLLDLDAMLGSLKSNGGSTQTIALLAGSPAVDAGSNPDFLLHDQRGNGFARTKGIDTDIGAYEFQSALPPTVTGIVFGNGTNQRSTVRQLVVTFSEPVTFMGSVASAFTLHRSGTSGTIGDVTLSATPGSGTTNSVTITFSGSLTESGGSLVDGFYDFIIDAAEVSGAGGLLDGNNDAIAGGSYSVIGTTANMFYRLFGDDNGDGTVNQVDFNAFRMAFLAGPNAEFDFNTDGNVTQSDFNAFRLRYLASP